MPSSCIFCGGRPTTNEHIVPEWMSWALREGPAAGLPGKLPYHGARLSGEGELLREYDTEGEIVDVTVNAVCGPCNHGWMERIETTARPYLTEMVLGNVLGLDRRAQRAVASWLALKAILSSYTGLPEVERPWIDLMYQRQIPPSTWHIWIGGYQGKLLQYSEAHHIVNRHFMRASRRANGVLMTGIVGFLAFQVLGVYKKPTRDPDDESLIRLWPRLPGSRPVDWPPVRVFRDHTIPLLFEHYNDVFGIPVASGVRDYLAEEYA